MRGDCEPADRPSGRRSLHAAGACGLGALRAARRSGVWGIGVDVDQSSLGAHMLTSVAKSYDVVMVEILRLAKAGRARTRGMTQFGLAEGAADLGRISPRVPASVLREVAALRRQLVSGAIRVPGVRPR